MSTGCILTLFEFAPIGSHTIVASFSGDRITIDAGALLLGVADRVIGLSGFYCEPLMA